MYTNRSSNRLRVGGILSFLLVLTLVLSSSLVGYAAPPQPDGAIAGTFSLPSGALQASIKLPTQKTALGGKSDSSIAALVEAAKASTLEAVKLADAEGIRRSGKGIQVQVVTTPDRLANAKNTFENAGGQVTGIGWGDTRLQGWLPVQALETVAVDPSLDYLRLPEQVSIFDLDAGTYTTEGLVVINGPAWHSAGFQGAGVKVAIIDGGFIGYPSLLGSDLPASVTVKNFVDGESDSQVNGTTEHGAACAEVVYDIAPQATIYLAKIGTDIDLQEAVTWAKSNSVDVISTSLGWYNLTPGDGTGYFANIVQDARNNGILWTTAASNDREAHWGGAFNDTDADGTHDFNVDQNIDYFGPGDGNAYFINPGYAFRVFLRWDDWAAHNQDYDLYLVRWNGSGWDTVASSQEIQNGGPGQTPTEYAAYVTSGTATAYGFAIVRYSSTRNVNMEIFAPKMARLDELVHARSLANLADSPEAVTVAALDVISPYPQESYSSEGPANGPGGTEAGGFVKPDISGFANVSTVSYGTVNKFNGTSSATPHVAGAAVLVQNAYPAYTPAQIESFLTGRAVDMGAAGMDTIFGYGRLYLGAPPSSNTPPTISGLPDQTLPMNGSKNDAIDLWAYANDLESPDNALTFTINNSPTPSAGVAIDSNRYVDIFPAAGWTGQTDVEIKVTDPGGLFSADIFQVTVTSGKTWTGGTSADWHTAANWDPAGVPTAVDDVFITDVANDPVISTGNAAVKNLTLSPGAVLDLTDRLLTADGTVINNGTLKQTQSVTQAVTSNFLRIMNQSITQTKYYGLDLTPTVSNSVTVMLSGNQFCQGRSTGVKRCYDISPASGQSATVRFYLTEAERNGRSLPNLKVLHYSGTWTPEAGPTAYGGSGDQQYVEAQNISDFSPFALDELLTSTKAFLPLIQRDQTQPPATPVLNPIPTPNQTGSYAVSWSTANLAASYTLEEDAANTFPHPTQVYNGPNTTWNASAKTNGLYCYRVRANNANGSSAWSAAQCVTVSIPTGPTPGFWAGPGVELYVTADRQYVHNFAVYISVQGCGNYKITHTSPDAKITNNQFSFGGSFYASGTFTSSTTSSGSGGFSHFYISGCGYITGTFGWSAIWANSSPPSFAPQEVIRLEGDRPVLRSFELH